MHHGLREHLLERLDVTAVAIAISRAFLMPNRGPTLRHSPMATAGGYSRYEAGGAWGVERGSAVVTGCRHLSNIFVGRVLDLDFIVLHRHPKFITIDEQPDDDIVHLNGF
jgi:hypothetical protein